MGAQKPSFFFFQLNSAGLCFKKQKTEQINKCDYFLNKYPICYFCKWLGIVMPSCYLTCAMIIFNRGNIELKCNCDLILFSLQKKNIFVALYFFCLCFFSFHFILSICELLWQLINAAEWEIKSAPNWFQKDNKCSQKKMKDYFQQYEIDCSWMIACEAVQVVRTTENVCICKWN